MDRDEAVGMIVRKRPQENAVDHAEHARRRADAERQRRGGDDREERSAAEDAEGVTQISSECAHGDSHAGIAKERAAGTRSGMRNEG
jgi:hypothetical protein